MEAHQEPDPPNPEQKPKAKPTRYVVLRQDEFIAPPGDEARPDQGGEMVEAWTRLASAEAPSDVKAIEIVCSGLDGVSPDGTFVAIPARSFRPRTRKVKTVEQTSWE